MYAAYSIIFISLFLNSNSIRLHNAHSMNSSDTFALVGFNLFHFQIDHGIIHFVNSGLNIRP